MKATASINPQAVCFMRPVLLAKNLSARAIHLISMKELGILLGLLGGRLDPLKPFENPIMHLLAWKRVNQSLKGSGKFSPLFGLTLKSSRLRTREFHLSGQ